MSYNINKDLVQAYQKVVINEVAFKAEFIACVHEELLSQGYNLTESDVEQICLSEVNWASLGRMISRAASAGRGAGRGVSTAAREFAQGARVQRAAERVRQGQQAAQAAPQATPRVSTAQRLGQIAQKLVPGKKTLTRAAKYGLPALGAEGLYGAVTGQKSVGADVLGATLGGAGNIVKIASSPLTAAGYTIPSQLGDTLKSIGQGITDWNRGQRSGVGSVLDPVKPEEQKKKEVKRFKYDDQGRITGFEESYSEDEDVQLYNYIVEVLITDGVASTEEESAQLIEQAIDYLYESEKELVMLNNKPGIMIPDPNNPGKKKWQAIDPKKYPNYAEMEASYVKRRGEGQIKQDVKTAQEMEAAQKKAREEKAKQPEPPEPKPEEKTEAKPEAKTEAKPEAKTEAKPEAKTEAKPEAKTEAKPEAKAAPTTADYMKAASAARKSGDPAEMAKARDMGLEIWKKANPKLAAAQAERERVRGTAQTDNPMMQDMKSRMSLTPSVQSSTLKKDLGNLAGGHSRLVNNPNAAIAATPKPEEKKTENNAASDKDKATSYAGAKVKSLELDNKVSVGEKGSNPYKK